MKKYFIKQSGEFSVWKLVRNILLILIFVGAAFAGKVLGDINQTVDSVRQEVVVQSIREEEIDIKKGDPLNILLIGTDGSATRTEEEGDVSRSDTIMVVSLNPETKSTKLLSIPRDSYALIDGVENPDKINHAYAYGGAELTIDTIQNYLDIPIDYYAVINMDGLVELVDAIGGIEVTSPLTFEYRGTGFVKGETREVDGIKAMNFARMRYDDPQGEIGRQNRQKIVIKAIVDKLLSLDAVANYPALLKVVSDNIQTDFNLSEALNIAQQYLPALENIGSVQFESMEDLYVDEVFYFYIPLSARVKVANELRLHSNLAPIGFADLASPMDEDVSSYAKTMAIIMNQYPTGLSDEQMAEIINSQESVQSMRENEYYEPAPTPPHTWIPPVYEQPNVTPTPPPESIRPPESSVPPEVSQPPVEPEPEPEPPAPEQPVIPSEPVDPPVDGSGE